VKTKMRQALVYFPHTLEIGKGPAPAIDVAEKPSKVWTLYHFRDLEVVPALPYMPVHHKNAFVEDYVHDWNWRDGKFRYFSRILDGRVWLLLEHEVLT
jgi:hypothetical protein